MEDLKQWPTITYEGRFSNIFSSHYRLKDLFESNFFSIFVSAEKYRPNFLHLHSAQKANSPSLFSHLINDSLISRRYFQGSTKFLIGTPIPYNEVQ